MDLKIIPTYLLEDYKSQIEFDISAKLNELEDSDLSIENFNFYISVSAVFSSKIEGEDIELDSYVKHKRFDVSFIPDYTKKIDDLYEAYDFAKGQTISFENILKAHAILTKNILSKSKRGVLRNNPMYVLTEEGKIEYVAASPFIVNEEMDKWMDDLNLLLKADLDIKEIFHFASLLHLTLLKIHPFDDGNGRMSSLVEKWFLAQKIREKTWLIQSEKYYYNNKTAYYNNIRKIGLEYENLDYSKALKFTMMLPNSIKS